MATLTLGATAQLQTPQPSPNASVMQQVGITEINVTYSSPGVKDRTIWGELVPYDEYWRAGANANTKVSFSTDVTVEGNPVEAGTYCLGIMPKADGAWTVVLAEDGGYGDWSDYADSHDVARFDITPVMKDHSKERLLYVFTDTKDGSSTLSLHWEKVKLPINIAIDTDDMVMANIKSALEPSTRDLGRAARYCLENDKNLEEALSWASLADDNSDRWYYSWLHAALLDANGKYSDAHVKAKEAWNVGEEDPDSFFFRERVQKLIADLETKM